MTGVVDEITAYHNAVAVQTKSQYANKPLRFPVPVQDLQAVYLKYPEMRTELLLDELTQHSVVVDKLLGRPMCGRVWHNYSQKNKEVFNLATLLITVKWSQLFERIKKLMPRVFSYPLWQKKNINVLLIFHMSHWH